MPLRIGVRDSARAATLEARWKLCTGRYGAYLSDSELPSRLYTYVFFFLNE